MTARPHTQGHTPQQSMQRDAAPDISAASLSFCPVPHRLFTHCGAVADAACSDDRCSTLRWPTQRAVSCAPPRSPEARRAASHLTGVQKKPEPGGMHRHGFWPASILKTKFSWLSYSPSLVLQRDSAAGASVSACATLSAQLGVDRVLLALRDSSYGTLVDTCAACNTIITNYVCHNL